jgi:hypothetical protein
MTYIGPQKQQNLVVVEYGIQTLKVVVVVLLLLLLSFDVFIPTTAHPSLFLDNVVRRDILECQYLIYETFMKHNG